MDKDQLEKRVKWLDDERRKDKGNITELQKKIAKLEGLLDKSSEHFKGLSSEVTRLTVMIEKIDAFDTAISAHREEVKKELDKQEKRGKRRESDFKKRQKLDVDRVNKKIEVMDASFLELSKFKDELLTKQDDDARQNRLIAELQEKIQDFADADAERQQSILMLAEERRQDEKRNADMQGEISALRKRSDEHKIRLELALDGQKKSDAKTAEVVTSEHERRQKQSEFVEKISLMISDQEKVWSEWSGQFTLFEKQSDKMAENLQTLDEVQRNLRKAQQEFEDINQQISRRINEITEMQRLGEERFRQEWATFKSEDQKRWANYTLLQEEQRRDLNRQTERLVNQHTNLEENLQEVQDLTQHLNEQTEKSFQAILTSLRDWVAENERFAGSMR